MVNGPLETACCSGTSCRSKKSSKRCSISGRPGSCFARCMLAARCPLQRCSETLGCASRRNFRCRRNGCRTPAPPRRKHGPRAGGSARRHEPRPRRDPPRPSPRPLASSCGWDAGSRSAASSRRPPGPGRSSRIRPKRRFLFPTAIIESRHRAPHGWKFERSLGGFVPATRVVIDFTAIARQSQAWAGTDENCKRRPSTTLPTACEKFSARALQFTSHSG